VTISYKLTEKGRSNLGSFGGHLDRMMKQLAAKKELTLEQLNAVVKRHTESSAPETITSWYLSQAHKMGYVKREVK
jgi:hypothetical protein